MQAYMLDANMCTFMPLRTMTTMMTSRYAAQDYDNDDHLNDYR